MNCAEFSGAVYVYIRVGSDWFHQAYVKASNTEATDTFGITLALSADGNILVVGAPLEDSAATGVNNIFPGQSDDTASNSGAIYLY